MSSPSRTTSSLKHACSTLPLVGSKDEQSTPVGGGAGLMSTNVWRFRSDNVSEYWDFKVRITYAFVRDSFYTKDKQEAVENVIKKDKAEALGFKTWEDYANIEFFYHSRASTADVCITFHPGSSWSVVGNTGKIAPGVPTLNLGWLSGNRNPTKEDRGIILHQFGHVLGLMHEHQSPARGEYIHLDEFEVYNYYTQLLGSRENVKSQIIDVYNKGEIMNMTKYDAKSIMMFFMPARLNVERIEVPANTTLSKLDKALIQLNYPPNLTSPDDATHAEKLNFFIKAMIDVGVTNSVAGEILDAFVSGNKDDPASCYEEARRHFSKYNMNAIELCRANSQLLNTIDPGDLKQFGVKDFLTGVIKNPLFESIIKSVIQSALVQRGIQVKETIPASSSSMVTRMIGDLSLHPEIGDYVKSYVKAQKPQDVRATSKNPTVSSGVAL